MRDTRSNASSVARASGSGDASLLPELRLLPAGESWKKPGLGSILYILWLVVLNCRKVTFPGVMPISRLTGAASTIREEELDE